MPKGPKITVKDICRVALDQTLSNRDVAKKAGVSPTTISKYRNLMKIHDIDREKIRSLSDAEVEDLVQARYQGLSKHFIEPEWGQVSTESQKRDVTVGLLYQEYVDGFSAHAGDAQLLSESSFTRRLREVRRKPQVYMRQKHIPGQKMFVDFSGKHLNLVDPDTKKRVPVEIFVATLGASQLIFVTAVPSQKVADWTEANVRALEYFGGVPQFIVPDNLKAAVTTPRGKGREARINRTYLDFADCYGVVIDPARSLHPQDKALVEIGVRITNIWLIAALRNRVFHNIADMNFAISECVERINNKLSRKLKSSRRAKFEECERDALSPLPAERYEVVEWRDALLVPRDYHINCVFDYYSVPHALVGQRVSCAISRSTVRIFTSQHVAPVAVHARGRGIGETITAKEHMPESHRSFADDTPDGLLEWAFSIGEDVYNLFTALRENSRITPFSALRQMSRAKRLAREYGADRFLSACKHANTVGTQTVESVSSILKYGIDLKTNRLDDGIAAVPVMHENVRGAQAYDGGDNAK